MEQSIYHKVAVVQQWHMLHTTATYWPAADVLPLLQGTGASVNEDTPLPFAGSSLWQQSHMPDLKETERETGLRQLSHKTSLHSQTALQGLTKQVPTFISSKPIPTHPHHDISLQTTHCQLTYYLQTIIKDFQQSSNTAELE